jgi:hypothetical protein
MECCLISISIWEHKGKSERQGSESGENSGQAANCRAEIGFCSTVSPAIAPSSAFAARDCAGARAHLDRTGAWPASGRHACDAEHYCQERVWALGGARGSKGSLVWQRSLSRWRRMRSTTRGSVIKETIIMRAPQAQTRGSTSKIFLTRRAHVLRVSLEKSALSCSASGFAAAPARSLSADEMVTLARLE